MGRDEEGMLRLMRNEEKGEKEGERKERLLLFTKKREKR